MENDSDTEMELYEEIVGDVNCPTPNNSRAASPKTSAYSSSRRLAFEGPGALKMQEWKKQEWKMREQTAGVENAGVDNAGAITDGKP